MLTILEPIFLLLIAVAHHPLNTLGGTTPEDSSVSELSEALKQLQTENEMMKKEIANMKTFSNGRFLGYVPVVIEPQQSVFHNILTNGRNKDEKKSRNYDVSEFHNILTTVRSQEEEKLPKYDEQFNCIGNCRSEDESCSTATLRNESKDGVYLLKEPKPDSKPFYVYCQHETESEKLCEYQEKKGEGAWTVIQRRQEGSISFDRTALDFKLGFGDLNGEYWIGLERLHQITNSRLHELLIVLYDSEIGKSYLKFSKFVVGSEDENYKLTVGYNRPFPPEPFLYHKSRKFSAKVPWLGYGHGLDCSQFYGGGWWYPNKERRICTAQILTEFRGCYDFSSKQPHEINWVDTLHKVVMAIRPTV